VLNIKTQSIRYLPLFALVLLSAAIIMPAHAETTRYVSDELKIPLRSGASEGHRIIKFIHSGIALTVQETSEDSKYIHVELSDGKSGWVLNKDTMNVPSGRDRLAAANKKWAKSEQQMKLLNSTIAELKSEIKQLQNEKGVLQNESTNLSNSLEDLKITTANPQALAKKNKQLKKELSKVRKNETMLEEDNQQLRSNVTQEWFLIGAAVSIGSLLLGLILTRINWRRKRNSWGDSF
jgi:SH3 domain protein